MDKRLLRYYNRELQHLRGTAGEFAKEFPKIASRLSLDAFACADPYVERLLEGFALLAARVQLKLDAEFPQFTQSILETIYPHYLSPTPSMVVAQFVADVTQGAANKGYFVPRDTVLRSIIGKDDRTACEYRTGHGVTLWPITIDEVEYTSRDLSGLNPPNTAKSARAYIRIRINAGGEQPLSELNIHDLTFYIRGTEAFPIRVYEQIFGQGSHLLIRPSDKSDEWQQLLPSANIERVGFENDEALLPVGPRSFQGYRLLHEYFAFPQRFLFFRLSGLREGIKRCHGSGLDLIILMKSESPELQNRLDRNHLALHCTPAINLFPKRTDRVHLTDKTHEFHVVPNRTRPLDFEVYQVKSVTGYGVRSDDKQPFTPFYAATDASETGNGGAYFTVYRTPRLMSRKEKEQGRRSSYSGSEVFLSLVDSTAAPYRSDLRQLAVETLCTNRDLPIQMGIGRKETDFNLDISAPVTATRCLSGPTPPRPSVAEGETSWRMINHLCLNYLSLIGSDDNKGANAIRDLLRLYSSDNDLHIRRQIEGVLSVNSRPIRRRICEGGHVAFVRGLEIILTLDEMAFEGTGAFLLGAVMEVFFAKYVSINSFTETVIKTKERGEIMRWTARSGTRHIL